MTTDFDDLPIISGKCGCLCYCDGTDQERDPEPSFHWEDHGCAILSEIDSISMRCSLILASPLQGERIKVRGFDPSARILPTKRSSPLPPVLTKARRPGRAAIISAEPFELAIDLLIFRVKHRKCFCLADVFPPVGSHRSCLV